MAQTHFTFRLNYRILAFSKEVDMTSSFKSPFFLFFFILVLSIGSPVWAQSGGTLEGTVLDDAGKFPLPTVRIALAGTKIHGATDAEGVFAIGNIPAGVYRVTFELSGYLTHTEKQVVITAGQMTELNVTMKMGFAHEMTVTARREIVSLQKVPQNIEVLTSTELEDTATVNIVQALNNVTGVDVATGKSLTGVGTFMSINGYDDIYIKKMVDGVDVSEVVTNWSMLNSYPQEMLEQVEVIKGGASSVWGSNMAGIINIVTKRPRDMERPMISLKGTFSTFGKMDYQNASALGQSGNIQRYSANILGTRKDLGYMLGYKYDNHDLFTDNGKEKNQSIFAKLGYNFTETTYLDFLYSYNKFDTTSHEFLEYDLFKAWGFPYYWNYNTATKASSQAASFKLSSLVLPALNLEAQVKFNRMYGEFTRLFLEGAFLSFPPWGGAPGTETTSSFTDQKLGFTVKGSYNPSETFSLISGMDYYRVKADFTDYVEDQPIIYVDEVAPFINAEYRIGGLGLHAGARYDYDSSFGSQVSPSLGANFNFFKSTLLRVNVARTFRVPPLWYTLGESYADAILPNPDLLPERAWAYSAGFESQELEYVWVKVSLYLHKMTDGIVRVPHSTPGRFTWGNTDKFTRRGYEAELGLMTPIGLSGYVGTNYNDHKNDTEGEILDWIPTRSIKSGLKFKNEKHDLLVNLRGRWIWWNESEGLIDLFEPRDKVLAFDLRVTKGFAITENARIAVVLDVYNLSNRLFWDRKDDPNPRRWASLGFELMFK